MDQDLNKWETMWETLLDSDHFWNQRDCDADIVVLGSDVVVILEYISAGMNTPLVAVCYLNS